MWPGIHTHFLSESSAGQVSLIILAWIQFGLLGQKCRIVKRIVIKLCAAWLFLICVLFLWFAEVSTKTLFWAIVFFYFGSLFTDLAKHFVPWCRGHRLRLFCLDTKTRHGLSGSVSWPWRQVFPHLRQWLLLHFLSSQMTKHLLKHATS